MIAYYDGIAHVILTYLFLASQGLGLLPMQLHAHILDALMVQCILNYTGNNGYSK